MSKWALMVRPKRGVSVHQFSDPEFLEKFGKSLCADREDDFRDRFRGVGGRDMMGVVGDREGASNFRVSRSGGDHFRQSLLILLAVFAVLKCGLTFNLAF